GIAGRSDSGQGELFRLAHNFYNYFGKRIDGNIINTQWLKDELIKFIQVQANDSAFIEYLTLDKDESGDYYDWGGLKYFLASYEQGLQEKQKKSIDLPKMMAPRNPNTPNDFFHKEHIWAVRETSVIDDIDHRDVNKRRLGNFILLNEGLNITVSDKRIEEKIEMYFNVEKNTPNTLMIRELEKFFTKAQKDTIDGGRKNKTSQYWYEVYQRFFDMREEKMINFALERWRVPEIEGNISKVKLDSLDTRNEIYTNIP
ncbi:MAG: DUF1524 domain-containing protein, partial [Gammaproteobacteria bacterium]|nr:DUF1524 domain-containing protein [Gammaproteobacteria bacterium]